MDIIRLLNNVLFLLQRYLRVQTIEQQQNDKDALATNPRRWFTVRFANKRVRKPKQ